jgi:hypothetical protein
MVLANDELQRAEESILLIIESASEPFTASALFARLAKDDISELLARAAIWYLIDKDKIELTPDRRLSMARTQP